MTSITFLFRLLFVIATFGVGAAVAGAVDLPDWAYPMSAPAAAPPPDDGQKLSLEGSKAAFTATQLRDFFTPPDWYPEDHAPMPPLAAHGARPDSFACGFCHLPTGYGRPENAPIAGLPAGYIIKQVQEMASGTRKSALPDRYPQMLMTKVAVQAAGDPGLAEAAAYFAAIKPQSFTRVVETDTIPKIESTHWILKKSDAGGTEALGDRMVELPDDYNRFLRRDGHLTYTAYVPMGSVARGADLVKTGGVGKTTACGSCHGPDLKGLGAAPPIAGRSPSYTARQLFDFKSGARNGEGGALMQGVVAGLSESDIIAVTAYLATLAP